MERQAFRRTLSGPSRPDEDAGRGLTAAEVAERVRLGQVNRPPRSGWAEYGAIVRRNGLTLFNGLVVPAAAALFLLEKYEGAWAVSALAVVNTAVGLVQEIRVKRHLDRLALLTETRVRVVRDGREQAVPVGDVVRGDRVLLAAGEPVVADGPVLAARFLEVDEALLTGESDPVPRRVGEPLLSGSFCVAGDGAYRAERVGAAAFAHQTAAEARQYRHAASPLQKTIDLLLGILTALAVALCLLYVGLYFVRRFAAADLVEMVAATVTSMVPQGLVLMTTLAFTLAAVRLSKRGAVVQRLSAVESMAAVDVLCMDKTGTLTTNHLRLDQLRVLADGVSEDEVRRRLRLFAWASVDAGNKNIQALRAALGAPAAGSFELLDQLPFKSQNRSSAVRVRDGATERVLVLGAGEALRDHLEPGGAARWDAARAELLPTGLRLLLFCEEVGARERGSVRAWESGRVGALTSETSPSGAPTLPPSHPLTLDGLTLRPLAVAALSDELRPEAGGVLEALAEQGVAFKVLSGDNAETVRATVAHLRLPLAREPVVSGDELAAAADRDELVRTRSVFGRVAPRQKVEVVEALQRQGRHVAMLGDGVNDVLPIKKADLGIALGEGSAAARTVAGLVLENNNFELLPAALEEGRIILRNLRRAAKLFLLKNVYTLLLIVVATGLLGLPFPYKPQQVTLLNALTIGVPAFLITLSRARAARTTHAGFLRESGWFALSTGLVLGAAGLVVWLLAAWGLGEGERAQRTLLLSVLVLLGLGSLLRVLRHGDTGPGGWLWGWPALALPLYAAVMYTPVVRDFFELVPLTLAQWGLVLAVAIPALGVCLLLDALGGWSVRGLR